MQEYFEYANRNGVNQKLAYNIALREMSSDVVDSYAHGLITIMDASCLLPTLFLQFVWQFAVILQ